MNTSEIIHTHSIKVNGNGKYPFMDFPKPNRTHTFSAGPIEILSISPCVAPELQRKVVEVRPSTILM